MRSLVCGVVLASGLLGSASAEPDSLDDQLGPREMGVGEAMRAGATGATSIGLNPAGVSLNRELAFEGGYGYRGSDSATLVGVSACDSTSPLSGCFFYSYAGSTPELGGTTMSRTAHIAGTSLSRLVVPRIMVGVTGKYFRYSTDVMDESDAKGFSLDAGATVRLTETINVGVAGKNLMGTKDSVHFPRAIGAGLFARPMPALALSFDSRWRTDGGGPRFGGGAEMFVRAGDYGFPIRGGALRDNALGTTYVTGGLGIANLKWTIDVAARRAVDGGDETVILASMRFFGPRLAPPSIAGVE